MGLSVELKCGVVAEHGVVSHFARKQVRVYGRSLRRHAERHGSVKAPADPQEPAGAYIVGQQGLGCPWTSTFADVKVGFKLRCREHRVFGEELLCT
jgi:hypothetical protein